MQTHAKRGISSVLRRHLAIDRVRWASTEATKDRFKIVVLGGGASEFAET